MAARNIEAHMTTREPRLPYGCIVGKLARDIGPAIHDCAMSQKAKTLMACITADALGNAGWEPEHKDEAGLWCDMDTASWAATVKCSKQYISRLVDQLADLGLVTRHEAPKSSRASCRLRFNPDIDHWLPRQAGAHTERYSKHGAGRPRKNGSERNTPDYQEASVTHQISGSHNGLQEINAALASTPALSSEDVLPFAIRKKSDVLRSVGDENYSDVARQPAQKIIPLVTPARHEGSAGHAPEASEERVTEEETYRVPTVLAAKAASQPPLLEVESQENAKAPKGKEKETSAAPLASRKRAGRTGVTQEQINALWFAWESCGPKVIQRCNIGKREWGRHIKAMTDLVLENIIPAQIPALVAAKLQTLAWKKEPFVLKPDEIVNDLSTLRPIVEGSVDVTVQNNGHSQKGGHYVRPSQFQHFTPAEVRGRVRPLE